MATIDQINSTQGIEQLIALAATMKIDVVSLPGARQHVVDLWPVVDSQLPEELIGLMLHTKSIDELVVVLPAYDADQDAVVLARFLLLFSDEVGATEPSWVQIPALGEIEYLTMRARRP